MEKQNTKEKKKNIYLIGFMGCGKTTVSNYLHKEYNRKQIEMDEEIQKEEGMSISEIFSQKGEAYFRELETKLLRRLGREENFVVSCGGGVPMRETNVKEMKQNGKIVLLLAEPETIYERVKSSHNRPLLEGHMNVEYIAGLMEKRREKYQAAADVCVYTDGREVSEICREILKRTDCENK
ncbi:MAG TPA: shikimate kinase [Candidatus Blautia faecavium]|uniref:Shikimate kinase n=1 Tax=Candidatus Blautia faecavium TaxID=2838487 RepID=A0A9D2RXJ0_9FIRM|nr:shikimate kinase [Candidatus Blautia faecavium]